MGKFKVILATSGGGKRVLPSNLLEFEELVFGSPLVTDMKTVIFQGCTNKI